MPVPVFIDTLDALERNFGDYRVVEEIGIGVLSPRAIDIMCGRTQDYKQEGILSLPEGG